MVDLGGTRRHVRNSKLGIGKAKAVGDLGLSDDADGC
jgi:hypothetical protein